MKLLIAGSPSITNYSLVVSAIEESGFEATEVLSGGARGVDRLGERFAAERGVPVVQIKPDWSRGRHAGLLANSELVAQSEVAVVVYDGVSTGTQDTIRRLQEVGKPVFVKVVDSINVPT